MAQNSITPQQKAQAVDLGGMMAHVQAALQRYKTEVSDRKAASDHNHDSAYAAKSTTYTKTEVDQKFDEFAGPVYDPATRAIIFPATAKVSYDAANRAVVFG